MIDQDILMMFIFAPLIAFSLVILMKLFGLWGRR